MYLDEWIIRMLWDMNNVNGFIFIRFKLSSDCIKIIENKYGVSWRKNK